MPFLTLRPGEAPARLIFVDPDTKHVYRANSKEKLFKYIIDYRAQNNLPPIIALASVLENFWCGLPENSGKCQVTTLKRGWLQYLQGGVALLKNYFYGEENLASQEEADKRAAICIRCPHNVFPDKGPFLKWSDELAEASTGGLKSTYHEQLGNCSVCSCPLRAKVFYKPKDKTIVSELEAGERIKMEAVGCWQPKS